MIIKWIKTVCFYSSPIFRTPACKTVETVFELNLSARTGITITSPVSPVIPVQEQDTDTFMCSHKTIKPTDRVIVFISFILQSNGFMLFSRNKEL